MARAPKPLLFSLQSPPHIGVQEFFPLKIIISLSWGNTRPVTLTDSGRVRCIKVKGLSDHRDSAEAVNVVVPTPADEAVAGGDNGGRNLGNDGRQSHSCLR